MPPTAWLLRKRSKGAKTEAQGEDKNRRKSFCKVLSLYTGIYGDDVLLFALGLINISVNEDARHTGMGII